MARPTKQGVDYFPVDVQFDDKIELYLLEKESEGLAVLITLWQLIYQNEGYYIKNGKDLFLLIKKRTNVPINIIDSCINLLLDRGIFSKPLHKKHKILTSKAIQKRYFISASKKKIVYYNIDYIIKGIDVSENSVNVGRNATKEEVEEDIKEEAKELHPLQKYIIENKFESILKLKKQLTLKEAENLVKDFDRQDIKDVLEEMENKLDLTKRYSTVGKTLRNWLKRRRPNKTDKKPTLSVD